MSVNRTELVAQIAERANLTKVQADAALGAFQDVLVESLSKGEPVKVTGLLSVERVERAAHRPQSPHRRGDQDPRGLRCEALRRLHPEEGRRQVSRR